MGTSGMFLAEVEVTLGVGRRLADEEITDLIEAIVDDLDRMPLDPSVGTCRAGDVPHHLRSRVVPLQPA